MEPQYESNDGDAAKRFFDMSPDLLCVLDFAGNIIKHNPAWRQTLGHDREDYGNILHAFWLHPGDRARSEAAFRIAADGADLSEWETRCLRGDGSYRLIKWKAVSDTDKRLIYAIGRDITELRERQELLQNSEKLSVVSQLAAGIAHEIRNPMTSLKGFLQLLRSKLVAEPRYEDYFTIMFDEFNRIEGIIGEFLVLAKPRSNDMKETRIDVLVGDVVKLLEMQAGQNKVRIRAHIEEGIPGVRCDENQLKKVFVNLLKNSVEAMPDGGTAIVQVQRQGANQLAVRFIDEGVGIPEDDLARLGEPFYTTKEKGTGLGLMVCAEIIKAHRGRLHIASELNKGTAVEVVLPLDPGTA